MSTNPFADPNYGIEEGEKRVEASEQVNPYSDPNYGRESDWAVTRGFKKSGNAMATFGNMAISDNAAAAERIRQAHEYAQANPGSAESQELMQAFEKGDGFFPGLGEMGSEVAKDWNEAKGFVPKLASVGKNIMAGGELLAEQIGNMAAPMVGMAAGTAAGSKLGAIAGAPFGGAGAAPGAAIGGVGGGVLGAGVGNAAQETGFMAMDEIYKAGIDPNDVAAVQSYLDEHSDRLLKQGATKGVILGAVDRLTMGIASKLLNGPTKAAVGRAFADMGVDATNKAAVKAALASKELTERLAADAAYQASRQGAQKAARNMAAFAVDPAGEFSGEYFGTGVATGEWDTKAAGLEALMGLGQSGVMFAGQKAYELATRPRTSETTKVDPASGAPVQVPATPSESMGINPNDGSLSTAAALAVDSGVSQSLADMASLPAEEAGQVDEDGAERDELDSIIEQLTAEQATQGAPAQQDATSAQVNAAEAARQALAAGGTEADATRAATDSLINDMDANPDLSISTEAPAAVEAAKAASSPKNLLDGIEQAQANAALAEAEAEGAPEDIKAIVAKKIPDMTADELQRAIDHYGPDHKRTKKLEAALGAAQQAGALPSNNSQTTQAAQTLDSAPGTSPNLVDQSNKSDERATAGGKSVILQNRDRSTPAMVSQMNKIAAAPDYLRAGTSKTMDQGAPVVFGEAPASAIIGRKETITDNLGGRNEVQYAVVEAADLIASNRADGTPNKGYAAGEAGKFRVMAGNGRAAGLEAGYKRGTAGNYRAELEADANAIGVDASKIRSMKEPMLVRVIAESDITQDAGDRSNVPATAQMPQAEQAVNDTQRIDISKLEFTPGGQPSAASVLRFINTMPESERGPLLNPDRTPTRQAIDRVMAATFKVAYGNDELVRLYSQATDPDARTVINALGVVAGDMARLAGTGEYDFREAASQAAIMAVNASRKGVKLADEVENADFMLGEDAFLIAQFMADNIRSGAKIAQGLRELVAFAHKQVETAATNAIQSGMFGDAPTLTRPDVLAKLKEFNDELQRQQQQQQAAANAGGLFGASPEQSAEQPAARQERQPTTGAGKQATASADGRSSEGQPEQVAASQPQATEKTEQTESAERPEAWRSSYLSAAKVARDLGVDPKQHKKLDELLAAIDAKRHGDQSEAVADDRKRVERAEKAKAAPKQDAVSKKAEAKPEQEAEAAKPKAETEAKDQDRFAGNKLFTADRVAAARARMKSKFGQINSGIDPEMLIDGMTVAGAYIESGIRNFSVYAKSMIEDFGDGVKPYLLSFWEGARNYPGLKADGMSTPDESKALFEKLLSKEQAAEIAPDAVGNIAQKPARRTRKTGKDSDMVLTQDWGVDQIDGYGQGSDREAGNATKDAFMKEARKYLNAVADVLAEQGYEPYRDKKGKAEKAVSANEGGIAVSGELSLAMRDPENGKNVYIHVGGSSLRGVVPTTDSGIAVMYRVGDDTNRYALKAGNTWAPVDLSASDLAGLILSKAHEVRAKLEAQGNEQSANEDADQGGEAEVRGGGDSSQQGSAQSDFENLAQGQPANDQGDGDAGDSGRRGIRESGEDVGGDGRLPEIGDAGIGRSPRGSEGSSDAGTRGAGSGRQRSSAGTSGRRSVPEGQVESRDGATESKRGSVESPAATGVQAQDFHIDNPLDVVGGTPVQRFNRNKAALELLQELEEEGRQATAEEQKVLAGYTGWGSFGQELFQGSWSLPVYRDEGTWKERGQWLRDALGESAWKSAQRSITNAHYTDPPTVMAMWDMVRRMGFEGGRVLEPSMGTGNFFSMMPADLKSRSELTGIELDETTGAIAKQLFPKSNIQIMGYQDSKTPDGFYDLVIGNWPFENTPIADRRYNKLNPMLHDYFFLKTMDQVRPGGIVIGITSAGSMDKQNTAIRRELARNAELITSVRLPSGAFEDYAGTSVVTDIVILRKRPERLVAVPDGTSWVDTANVKTPSGKDVRVNQFYEENPQNIIGTLDFDHGTTTFRAGMIVRRPENMAERLTQAVSMAPEGAMQARNQVDHLSYYSNETGERHGSLASVKGKLVIAIGERLIDANEQSKYTLKDAEKTKAREQELTDIIAVRKAHSALVDAERQGQDAKAQRKALRDTYNRFTKKHGKIRESFALGYLKKIGDPFYAEVAALENDDGTPAAVMERSTTRSKRLIDKPTIRDAYVLARNKSVAPSVADVAAIAGKTEQEVRDDLIAGGAVFEAPNGDVVPSDIYLSGNVRLKLREAEAALASGNEAMSANVKALSEVVPDDVPYFNIETKVGATWVPGSTYAEYIANMLGGESVDGISVSFLSGRWKVLIDDKLKRSREAKVNYGTEIYPFDKLVQAAMSNQTLRMTSRDIDGNEVYDHAKTEEVNSRVAKIREDFAAWLWSDPERRQAMEVEYNESRNAWATPKYDGSFLTFEGMALMLGNGEFNLRQHQADAIWRAIVNRRSLNAHEVGTGKTFTMAGIAVESRRYGIAKKPMILAHNANSESVADDFRKMYPAARVLYINNLDPANRAIRLRQIANDDWDAVVIPHSLLDRMTLREDTLMQMAADDIAALEAEFFDAAREDGVDPDKVDLDDDESISKIRSVTAKELAKARKRIIENIKKQSQNSSREGAVAFEDLGIDMILVDEVHEFKKPPIVTRMQMKGLNTGVSQRSIALQFLTRYIRRINNGGNVHTFTGTPITNTITEIYHQMRYVMESEMDAAGVSDWDGWFGSFATEVQDVELTAASDYEMVTRLAGFVNVPELRQMAGQYMDTVFADDMPEMQPREVNGKKLSDANLTELERAELLNGRTEGAKDRPYKKVVNDSADMTERQIEVFQQIQQYAQEWRDADKKQRKEWSLNGDPRSPIITEGIANKASFDARLLDESLAGMEGKTSDDPNSKASRVVSKVLEIYGSSPKAGQVIFSNQGFGDSVRRTKSDGAGGKVVTTHKMFSTVRDIVERLVQGGIPREQIEVVTGSTNKQKRKEIADAMNDGSVRVVIGSTSTLGVGVNMQRNLRAMHHLDAPYMPGDLEQRNGRGLRQGNQWNTVLEFRYMTDRLDSRRWQILAVKQRFINAFMKAQGGVRVIEGEAAADEQSDILESFSEAAGDPRILQRVKLQKKEESLMRKERLYDQGMADIRRQIRASKDAASAAKAELAQARRDKREDGLANLLASQKENFSAEIGGQKFYSRKEAAEALAVYIADNIRIETRPQPVGTYGGHPLSVHLSGLASEPVTIIDAFGETFEGKGIAGAEAQMRNYPKEIGRLEGIVTRANATEDNLTKALEQPFGQADDLAKVAKQLKELERDLAANPVPPPAWLRQGSPIDSEVFRNGKPYVVTGHRYDKSGWFILAEDGKGATAIPYMEATDATGMALYDEREFVAPGETKKQSEPEDVAFQRSQSGATEKPADAQRMSMVERVANGIVSRWANKPGVVVVSSMSDPKVPEAVREENENQIDGGASGVPEGFLCQGAIYVVASQTGTARDVARVVFHEGLGHYGLRGVFGLEGLTKILNQIITMRKAEIARKRKQYGLTNDRNGNLQAADELLAEMAQEKPDLGFVKRAIAEIRTWLRANVPMFANLKLSDAEIIRDFIIPARAWVESGAETAAATQGGTRFSRAAAQTINEIKNKWKRAGIDAFVSERNGVINLLKIVVPKDSRSTGIGTKAMQQLVDYADSTGQRIELTPSADFGGSKSRLVQFYKRFGFVENKGSNKDYAISEAMYRAPETSNIRFSRAAAQPADNTPDTLTGLAASKFDDFVYKIQDKHIDTKRIVQSIKELTGGIADALDTYLQETLFHGRAAKRTKDFASIEMGELTSAMSANGITKDALEEYLHARHAQEANATLAERNPNQNMIDVGLVDAMDEVTRLQGELALDPGNKVLKSELLAAAKEAKKWRSAKAFHGTEDKRLSLSGMSDAEAQAVLNSLTPAQQAKMDAVAAIVDNIIAKTRQEMVDYGLESQDTVDEWSSQWNYYIPLMREQVEDESGGMRGVGQGVSVKGREVKGRLGSNKQVIDILAHVALQRERTIVRGEKNRVAQSLIGLARLNPLDGFWSTGKVPMIREIDPATGLVRSRPDRTYRNKANAVVAKFDGKEVAVLFDENNARAMRMAGALKNLDAAQLEGLMGAVATGTRYLASVNTQYNPIFGVTNLVRDIQHAMLAMSNTAIHGKQARILGRAFTAVGEIFAAERRERKGKRQSGAKGKSWEEFQNTGGQTGYRDQFANSAERGKAIEKALNPDQWMESKLGKLITADGRLKAPMSVVGKTAGWLLDLLSDYNTAMENGVRLAAYEAGIDAGLTKERAAELAKNLTVNFNRKGQATQQIGAMYAFFNAAVQGTARIGESLFEMEPGKPKTARLSKTGKAIFAGGVLVGSMQAIMLAAAGFDDDEPPEFIRERNFIIPTGGKSYITIPMPLGYHVITNLGRIPTEFALGGGKNLAKHMGSLMDVMADVYNPLGGAGLSLQSFAPTVADPFVALAENKDFGGRPIARESFDKTVPGHQLARDTASLPATWLAQGINYVTGGSEFTRGEISPTPDQIDYLAGQLTGGVGRELTKASKTAQMTANGDEWLWHNVPLFGRFLGSSDTSSGKQSAYYSAMDDVRRHAAEVKGLRNSGRGSQAVSYISKHPEATLHVAANLAEKQVKTLRDRVRDMNERGASREEVRAVEQQMVTAMERFTKLVKEKKVD